MVQQIRFGPLISAGVLLGMGMGGFVDGILFHQILQTHNMLSAQTPASTLTGAKVNMFWDGVFHAAVWLMTALGFVLLVKAGTRPTVAWSPRTVFGAWWLGWGLFNLVEGIIDHHILGLHHVLEYAQPDQKALADYLFLASGLLFALLGAVLIRSGKASLRQTAAGHLSESVEVRNRPYVS
jgi:uncharacterized membrane protein